MTRQQHAAGALALALLLSGSSLARGAEAEGEEPIEPEMKQQPAGRGPEDWGCQDSPVDWTDELGRGCAEYEANGTCAAGGASEEPVDGNFSVTTACCSCGGGSFPSLPSGNRPEEDEDENEDEDRVHGGTVVTKSIPSFGTQLFFHPTEKQWWDAGCGSILVGSRHVLSAAHCNEKGVSEGRAIEVGTFNIFSKDNGGFPYELVKAAKVTNHPLWKDAMSSIDHDFAIYTLEHSVATSFFNKRAILADLDYTAELVRQGAWVTLCGRGLAEDNAAGNYGDLRCLEMPLHPWETCKAWRSYKVTERMLCAGGIPNQAACNGDSGGPLYFIDPKGNYVLVGVVSWGRNCGEANYLSVFANVSWAFRWITDNVPDALTTKSLGLKVHVSHQRRQKAPDPESQKVVNAYNEVRCRHNVRELGWSTDLEKAAEAALDRSGAFDSNNNYVFPAGSAGTQIAFKLSGSASPRDVVFQAYNKGIQQVYQLPQIASEGGVPSSRKLTAAIWRYLVDGDKTGKWRPAADAMTMIRSGASRIGCARRPRLASIWSGRSGDAPEEEEEERNVKTPGGKVSISAGRNNKNDWLNNRDKDPTWLCIVETPNADHIPNELGPEHSAKHGECQTRFAGDGAIATNSEEDTVDDLLTGRAGPAAGAGCASGAAALAAAASALALAIQ